MKKISKEKIILNDTEMKRMTNAEKAEINEYNKAVFKEKLTDYLKHPGHKMPVTRREFLSAGLVSFTGYMAAPSLLNMLTSSVAEAFDPASCPSSGAAAAVVPGLLTINPTGGLGTHAIVVPLDKGGALLSSYSQLSMGTTPNIQQAFGVPFNIDNPASTTFINQLNAAGITGANFQIIQVNCRSQNDTGNNAFGLEGMAAKAGFNGSLLGSLGRTSGSLTGGDYLPAVVLNPPSPLIVSSYSNIQNAVNVSGALSKMTTGQKDAILKTMNSFNDRQVASLASANGATDLNTFLQCAGLQNISVNAQGSSGINPAANATIAGIWGITNNATTNAPNNPTSEQVVIASMAYNTFSGQAGVSTFSKGGYDYHGNALASTQAQDVIIMDYAAKAVRTAAALNRPAAIMIRSDGAISSSDSTSPADWAGDNDNGTHLLMLYNPKGVNVSKTSVGAFTSAQSVDLTVGPADNLDLLTKVLMANIMQFAGKGADIPTITGLASTDPNIVVK